MNFLEKTYALLPSFILISFLCLPISTKAAEDCKQLLQTKCASCHFVKYICPKLEENRSSTYWQWTMHSMKKEGAVLSDKESSQLVDCLTAGDPQAKSFCEAKK